MHNIPEILYGECFKYLQFYSKHTMRRISQKCRQLKITDLCNIDYKYVRKLNDEILQNYTHATKLNANYNEKITDVRQLTKLKLLLACGTTGIDDKSIKNQNLELLDVCYNVKITDVNHMTNLKILFACGNSGINDYGLSKVNVEVLDVDDNPKVTNLNHMTNLRRLSAWGNSGVDYFGIEKLNLKILAVFILKYMYIK